MVSKKQIDSAVVLSNCVISTVIGFWRLKSHSKGVIERDNWLTDPLKWLLYSVGSVPHDFLYHGSKGWFPVANTLIECVNHAIIRKHVVNYMKHNARGCLRALCCVDRWRLPESCETLIML